MPHSRFLYHPQWVIEDAQKKPGLAPLRLFALLFPLWSVELGGTFREQKPYALLEEYIERGIFDGHLQTSAELAAFFGIDPRLVEKVLDSLRTIEHVSCEQERWSLRELGQQSLREGQKYIPKKSHQKYFFEALQGSPLTREHYERIPIYSEQEASELVNDYERSHHGYRCMRLYPFSGWDAGVVAALARRADRDKYNLRAEIENLHQVGQPELVYLPLYVVEARQNNGQRSYLAYSHVRGRSDVYFEKIVNQYPEIRQLLVNESARDQKQEDIWTKWLRDQGLEHILPVRMPAGIWQVDVPPAHFRAARSSLTIQQIGTYHLHDGHFLRIWCQDVEMRRNAALDRALAQIDRAKKTITEREVERNLQLLSTQLATRQLDLNDLKQYARETNRPDLVDTINAL